MTSYSITIRSNISSITHEYAVGRETRRVKVKIYKGYFTMTWDYEFEATINISGRSECRVMPVHMMGNVPQAFYKPPGDVTITVVPYRKAADRPTGMLAESIQQVTDDLDAYEAIARNLASVKSKLIIIEENDI